MIVDLLIHFLFPVCINTVFNVAYGVFLSAFIRRSMVVHDFR
jgi:hypothetical protein